MQLTNKEKKERLQFLISDIVNQVSDKMPKGVPMLIRSVVKQIPDDKVDETIDGALQFLAGAYVELEKIRNVPDEQLTGHVYADSQKLLAEKIA